MRLASVVEESEDMGAVFGFRLSVFGRLPDGGGRGAVVGYRLSVIEQLSDGGGGPKNSLPAGDVRVLIGWEGTCTGVRSWERLLVVGYGLSRGLRAAAVVRAGSAPAGDVRVLIGGKEAATGVRSGAIGMRRPERLSVTRHGSSVVCPL